MVVSAALVVSVLVVVFVSFSVDGHFVVSGGLVMDWHGVVGDGLVDDRGGVVRGDDNSFVMDWCGVVSHGLVDGNNVRDSFMDDNGMGNWHLVDGGGVLSDSLVVDGSLVEGLAVLSGGALVMFDLMVSVGSVVMGVVWLIFGVVRAHVVSAIGRVMGTAVRVVSLRVVRFVRSSTVMGLAMVGGVVVTLGVVMGIVVRGRVMSAVLVMDGLMNSLISDSLVVDGSLVDLDGGSGLVMTHSRVSILLPVFLVGLRGDVG